MMEIVVNGRRMKFYRVMDIYQRLLRIKESIGEENTHKAVQDVIKILESMDYDEDFKNYYRNLLNSLIATDKEAV